MASRVFTCSEYVGTSVIEHYGVEPDSVVAMGMGVSIEPICENINRTYSSRKIIFIDNDPAGKKGLRTLLEPFPLVRQEIKDAGRLVPPQDPESLAKVIVELLKDEATLRSMGEKGYERTKSLFTWEKVVTKIEMHLQTIT